MMATANRGVGHDSTAKISNPDEIRAGSPLPMGTLETGGGANFAIFSRDASRVRLELFDHPEDAMPARVIDLDSVRNRTGDVWHVWVKGLGHGQLYAYRMDGPYEPSKGQRYNFNRLLLDPFATAISRLPPWDFAAAGSGALPAGQFPLDAEMHFCQRALRVGWRPASPASLVEDCHL